MRIQNISFMVGFIFFLLTAALPCQAENLHYSLGVGFDYRTGDYGTNDSTDFYMIPLIVDLYPTDRLDFELIIPYLFQSNTTTVLADGQRLTVERPSRGRRSAVVAEQTVQVTEDAENTESGLGDMTLTSGYVLFEQGHGTPRVRPFVYLKIPTADEDKGLGTGEFDYGAGIELSGWFERWYAELGSSYIFQGDNDDFDLKDYLTYSGEIGTLLSDTLYSSASFWGATAPSEQSSHLLEAHLNATLWLSSSWSLEGYVAKGLSDDSPDYGAGVTLFRHF